MLTPNDFPSLEAVADRLLRFQEYYETITTPFQWRFTRNDLNALLAKTPAQIEPTLPMAA